MKNIFYTGVTILLFTFLISKKMNAQNLNSHHWKNRVILVKTNNKDNPEYIRQISDFENQKHGLLDRKLVLYLIIGDSYRFYNFKTKATDFKKISNGFIEKFFNQKSDFEILLLGLDGGIKLRSSEILDLEKIYSTIDAMPMRKNELKNRNK